MYILHVACPDCVWYINQAQLNGKVAPTATRGQSNLGNNMGRIQGVPFPPNYT